MGNLTFKYTILYVDNVAETLNFYRDAFGFEIAMLHESGDYGALDTGSTILSFSSFSLMNELGKNPARVIKEKPAFEIAFETTNVAAALKQALNAGALLVQEVEHMPWGQTTAYVSDKNGFLIELCTPIAA